MGSAILLGDVVGEWVYILLVAVVPLHGKFNANVVLFAGGVDHFIVVYRLAVAVKVFDESGHTTFIVEHFLFNFLAALVGNGDVHARV